MPEEARQENARIIISSKRPRGNLRNTEKAALKTLKDNTNLKILPTDKRNYTVGLITSDYKQKMSFILDFPAYRTLDKNPTHEIEKKITLLLKKSWLTEETRQEMCPASSRPPRM